MSHSRRFEHTLSTPAPGSLSRQVRAGRPGRDEELDVASPKQSFYLQERVVPKPAHLSERQERRPGMRRKLSKSGHPWPLFVHRQRELSVCRRTELHCFPSEPLSSHWGRSVTATSGQTLLYQVGILAPGYKRWKSYLELFLYFEI